MDPILAANPFIDNSSFTGSVAYGLPEKPQDSQAAYDSAAPTSVDWPTPLPGAAIPEHVPGEILVQFKPGISATQRSQARGLVGGTLLEEIHTTTMHRAGQGVLERLNLGNGQGASLEAAMAAIVRHPNVVFAERNYIHRPAVISRISNDTYYTNGSLWGMYGDDTPTPIGPTSPSTTNLYGSQAEKAWHDGITGSRNVVVGIIDEGIQISHPDLAANIWVNPIEVASDGFDNDGNGYIDDVHGWDFFYNNNSVYDAGEDDHGTHVAGTIGGIGGNGTGVAGVNWNVTMISTKFLGPNGGTTANAVKAVDYITDLKTRHGLNLVATNNSWGGGGYSQSLHDAIIRSAKQDILFVAAAGNASANNDAGSYYPSSYNTSIGTSTQTAASYDGVISVASITNTGAMSSFSSYGATTVDIGAPGSGVWSSVPTNSYASYSGTSMATPHVTGSLALYASVQPERPTGAALRSAILNSATPTASLDGKTVTGGRLNVYEALKESAFLSLDHDVYDIPGTAGLSVRHAAANVSTLTANTIQVSVRSTTEGTPETVVLTETGVNTGLFTGSIALNSETPAINGTLQVKHGDQVTATYAALNQTATALVDGVAPTISNVTATPLASSAEVRWNTNELASGEVRYGTNVGSLSQTATVTAQATSQLAVILGLTPQTTYFYQVLSRDSAGNESSSAISSFSTLTAKPILFVDDDQGATYERFFKAALDANAYVYDTWDAQSIGRTPSASDLALYRRVIWNTGYDFSAATAGISSTEEAAIQTYLNGGGRIFISGQDVFYNGVSAEFQTGYLKVASYANDVTTANHTETGMPGNAISNGMSLALAKPSDFPTLYVDGITPVAGAEAIFRNSVANSAFGYSAVSYRGDYSNAGFGVVLMTFPFEAISSSAADPNNQKFVMKKVMDYLDVGGTASKFVYTNPASYATTEGLTSISFSIKLASVPTADVTIAVSSSDTTEGTVNKSSLTFTPTNWNTPQTVIATGVNDAVDDGNIPYTILVGAATSTDSNYSGADPVDLFLTNQDNDTAGVTMSTPANTSTSEAGATASFTIKLNSEPTANVTIPLSSSDTTEGTVSPTSLTFTAANWNTAQTLTVTGVNDNLDDGDITYSAVIGTLISSDSLYNAVNPADISFTNLDNDTAGINVSAPSGTSTTESGGQVSFTLKLETQPTATVTLPISSSVTTEGTVSTNQLTFTTSDWNTPQTVTVTGANDGVIDGTIAYTALIGTSSSADVLYNGLDPADIALTNLDNDAFGITISEPSSTSTSEAGGAVTFSVVLNSTPSATVTIPVSSSDSTEANVSTSSLVYSTNDWNIPQTVTVTGLDDSIDDDTINYSVVLGSAISSDNNYNGLDPGDLSFSNLDNDAPPPTKFFVVNDGTPDRTYEYAADGSAVENYPTASGNTAPRGVATTAAGDKTWVVDFNRNVYVYNDAGGLQGAWTLGTVASNAQLQGIATDGTHIWVVDARADRVYYYKDAATTTPSGTLAATNSFALASGNTSPTDLVFGTGGSNGSAGTIRTLWVVNSASSDRVYRYTLGANDLAMGTTTNWALNSTNSTPTGIALDPSNTSQDLWVVDSGTDRVYRYANARTLSAPVLSDSFALAAGNTNPQGIADPVGLPSSELLDVKPAGPSSQTGLVLEDTQRPQASSPDRPRRRARRRRGAEPASWKALMHRWSRHLRM